MDKDIERYTVFCPDCDRPAYFDQDSEPVCPDCGLICGARQGEEVAQEALLVRDSKAAGRVVSE